MADQEMTPGLRYNYEAYKSASFNYGANFHAGMPCFDVTPMIGVYFGQSSG
jgi:hypothetical protein